LGEGEEKGKGFLHKLTTTIAWLFPDSAHGFEDLNKKDVMQIERAQ